MIVFFPAHFFAIPLFLGKTMDLKHATENAKGHPQTKRKRVTKKEKMAALLQDDVSMLTQFEMDKTLMSQLGKYKV